MKTPTTEQVRNLFGYNATNSGKPPAWVKRRMEAFDRWLAEHDSEVRAAEREACARLAEGAANEGRDLIGFIPAKPSTIAANIRSRRT